METTIVYTGYTGIMEKKMETTVVYRDYIGIMEKKMETHVWIGFGVNREGPNQCSSASPKPMSSRSAGPCDKRLGPSDGFRESWKEVWRLVSQKMLRV